MQGPSTGFSTLLPFCFPALCFRLELSYPTGQFHSTPFSPVCFSPLESEVSWIFLACELLETCVALLWPFGILPFHFIPGFHLWSISVSNLIFPLLTALLHPIPFQLAVSLMAPLCASLQVQPQQPHSTGSLGVILPDSVTPLGIASARHAGKRKCLSSVIKQTHRGKNGQPGVELGLPVFFKNLPYIGIVICPLIPSNL